MLTQSITPEQMLLALEHSFDQVVGYDRDLRIIFWNKGAEDWFRIPREQAIGKHILEQFPLLKDDPRLEYLHRVLAGETFHLQQERGLFREVYYQQRMLPMRDAAGAVTGVLVIARDQTEETLQARELEKLNLQLRAQNILLEERTRLAEAVSNASTDFITVLDKDLRYISVNKAYEDYFYPRQGSVIGRHYLEVYPFLEDTYQYEAVLKALGGEPQILRNQSYTLKEGSCDFYLWPLGGEHEEVSGVLIVVQDTTEQHKAINQLNALNEALEEKNRQLHQKNLELETLTHIASSDILESVGKVQALAGFLSERDGALLSDAGREYLKRLQKSVVKVKDLLLGLNFYHQLQQDTDRKVSVDLNALLRKVRDKAQEVCPTLHFTCTHLPPITGHEAQLQQLFEELVGNAVKFRRPGNLLQVHLAHRVISRPAGGEGMKRFRQFTLSDNGIGFDPALKDKVFQLFYKIHGNFENPGKGLGLPVCRKIVEQHGGTIEVVSDPGRGTVVIMEFPG
ncbi:MAG TPA: PAS domain-containing protein [Chitinophagaceae bacterium]|jgi:PAS domain S-box-containing protein|nr:PAS domain-containing protein [Chitinophagaceae bacterium]